MANETIKQGKKAGLITYKVGEILLAREYNPNPTNPKTEKQVSHRAKIKLLSQIAAIFRAIIAIFPTSGKSARSIFLALNWQSVYTDGIKAKFRLTDLKLTDSVTPLGSLNKLVAASLQIDRVWLYISEPPPQEVGAVFYYIFHVDELGNIVFDEYRHQEVRDERTDIGYFPAWFTNFHLTTDRKAEFDYYMFALGMIGLTPDAWQKWVEEPYEPCQLLANVIKGKYITADDFAFTETRSLSWYRGEL